MGLETFNTAGTSNGEKLNNGMQIDSEDDDLMETDDEEVEESLGSVSLEDMGEDCLKNFFKKASISFFEKYGLISHQINSYNEFINSGIQKVFDSIGEISVSPGFDPSKKGDNEWRYASVRFGKITLEPPSFSPGEKAAGEIKLLPRHARLQNMTYSCQMKVETFIEVYTQKLARSDKFKTGKEQCHQKEVIHEEKREVFIGRMPVMVKSGICWMSQEEKGDCEYDQGGYFIIKGAEKTFIAQEQVSLRRLWIANNPSWSVAYRSEIKRKRVYLKLVASPKVENISCEKVLSVYFMSSEMPVWLLFFALGVSSDKEVVDLIDFDTEDARVLNVLFASIYDADEKYADFRKEGNSFKHLEKLIRGSAYPPGPDESIEDCVNQFLFSSLSSFKKKATFLGYMVKCLLQAYIGQRKCDNRDDFRNKRLDLAGELLERELRVHIKHAERRMVKALQRDLYGDRQVRPMEQYLDASIITNGLSRAFSTGAWSHPYKKMERLSGVIATLRRANPLQMTADMRKTRQQVQYAGKVGDARYPHPSHWGKICFLSTTDGENCGLVKNLAATGLVSTNVNKPLLGKLYACGMKRLIDERSELLSGKHKVFLNGEWVGVCEDSITLVTALRNKRRRGKLPPQVEVKRDELNREVRIYSDAGRILRPLAVVNNLRKIKTFKENKCSFQSLLDTGVIELVGIEEEEDCMTAWGVSYLFGEGKVDSHIKYTHCELDLSFLLGVSCGIIPFANHDHARRALYQSEKHSQQAIGYSTTNPDIRVDTLSHQMYYPQRPLFRTMISDCLGRAGSLGHNKLLPREELYNGQNAIVAVNVHLGYNQEDSLVMNRASVERGMFRTEHVRSYKAEVENKESLDKKRRIEDAVIFGKIQSKIGRVDSLDDDGFPYIGANLQNGDIVIGRCTESGTDNSIKLKHTERGMVQKVVLSANDEGKNFAVVSLRQVRSPCLGDKFSSMHGQKGVLGYLESQENFPFTIQGIVPDIVINPHAFPSRQTPGQLLEAALGKGIACGGQLKYATPFSTLSVDAITDQLQRAGFSRWGNERVYNGRTGEMVSSLIFMGPTFYQRLIHMAEDKVKFRNTGPVHPLTRQPVTDRKRFGGIKFGEMERDCLIAHGAAANLHERLFTLSDSSQMHICTKCKNMANVIQRTVTGGRKVRVPIAESVNQPRT